MKKKALKQILQDVFNNNNNNKHVFLQILMKIPEMW